MKFNKKVGILSVVLLLLFAFVAQGCSSNSGQTPQEQTNTGDESTASTQDQTAPLAEPVEVELLLQVWELPPENDPIKAEIEKATNTKITLNLPPVTEYSQKMMAMVASGSYPDMMNIINSVDWRLFADQGAITPVDGMLETHGPVLLQEIPEDSWALYRSDGKLWGVPRVNVRHVSSLFARQDWIVELGFGDDWADELGKEDSKPLDEFYALLKAMKDKKGATLSGFNVTASLAPFYGAFGTSANNNFYSMENGEFIRSRQSDRMREALAWLNMLYADGIIDPEIITNQQEQINNKAARDEIGMVYDIWNLPSRLDNDMKLKETNPSAEWVYINQPTGPHGDSYMEPDGKLYDGVMVISSKSKAPEKCIEILNYLRGDGYEVSTYGIEGDFYTWEGEGENRERVVTELGKSGWVHTYTLMRMFWDPYWFYPVYGDYAEPLEDASVETKALPNISDCAPIGPVYKQYGNDLDKYEVEMITKFITGDESLDKWDDYVSMCQSTYHVEEINKEIHDLLQADGRLE